MSSKARCAGRLRRLLCLPFGRVDRMNEVCWTSQRGDEWWCGDASAGYACNAFTIGSFGKDAGAGRAFALICAARSTFPDAMLYIYLDDETRPLLIELSDRNQVTWTEIEISNRTRMAKIESIGGR